MVVILDYNVGNVSSIQNMIKRVGGQSKISADPKDIATASALILPGVGAFENGVQKLKASGLVDILQEQVLHKKKPVLGICLGMQLMTEGSEEGPSKGLGWIKGQTRRFDLDAGLKVPHMGWNQLQSTRPTALLEGLNELSRFYFVHSYYVDCLNTTDVAAKTEYGKIFTSVVERENIMGVQFHPEKSHRFGMTILSNFMRIAKC